VELNPNPSYDLVIYGSSGAGFSAAVQAARDGLNVVLLEPGPRPGGMTTNGLGATDIGNRRTIGGIAREFYQRIYAHYKESGVWRYESRSEYMPKHPFCIDEEAGLHFFFEPSAALSVMTDMLREANVEVQVNSPLDRTRPAEMRDSRLVAIHLKDGRRIAGSYFMDATYEGDLMALAAVPFTIGRESNSEFGERLNGFRPHPVGETGHVDPHVAPGDPASGLLPGIEPDPCIAAGAGDQRLQAYNFRLCLTDVADNRIPIEKPSNFDPLLYETLARHLLHKGDDCPHFPYFKRTPLPNRKTDSNNFGTFSTDVVGMSHEWPLASDEERRHIWLIHRDYTQGLLWFLGNDTRFPASWRSMVRLWGLAADEFSRTQNWPPQLYVREARRMRADYTVTELNCTRAVVAPDSVALGSYAMDSHQVSRFIDKDGKLRLDGGFWQSCAPYPISYRAIIPPRGSCRNLVVPVCLSATHAAYGSIRMEPVFMMLGQAGALAVSLAAQSGQPLQGIDYAELKAGLLVNGAVLTPLEETLAQ
jgi:hypothetical protein